MPKECLSFGFSCTSGASAAVLRKEVMALALPRTPDVVCILARGNNITLSRTIEEAGKDFGSLWCALYRWPEVFVLDFPPQLSVDMQYQELLRQEFH
ncbi:hypothetical protein ANANG_G00064060 [Anguilla anguilla]|uniref:Uncharacterized protein n=1 Tax=Anguilla anguilla TaxID=7936 RepID=A0A9D3MPG6_ANGAN|nr:hypothetical protein ANANG_G00064060 [Anguilla anguilla]